VFLAVLTTIQKPTTCVWRLSEKLRRLDAELIVAGDKKGPAEYPVPDAQLLSLLDQIDSGFELARALPTGHYARKNIAYLTAIQRGATCIYETDDDNAPNEHWERRHRTTLARSCSARPWANVYRMFSDEHIWPRGFPLDRITDPDTFTLDESTPEQLVDAPVQQGLANGSPDVDAIWRLTLDHPFQFTRKPSVLLPTGTWCPFNSQTTWWWPPAFPLLYLPSHCSFRMTDIWRGFIAQRCLWEMGYHLVFHAAEVDQARNEHNLLQDLEDEIPGYLNNHRIVAGLESLSLRGGEESASDNLLQCYELLVRIGVIPEKELGLVQAWLADLAVLQPNAAAAIV
jgi:hypothetical protein